MSWYRTIRKRDYRMNKLALANVLDAIVRLEANLRESAEQPERAELSYRDKLREENAEAAK